MFMEPLEPFGSLKDYHRMLADMGDKLFVLLGKSLVSMTSMARRPILQTEKC